MSTAEGYNIWGTPEKGECSNRHQGMVMKTADTRQEGMGNVHCRQQTAGNGGCRQQTMEGNKERQYQRAGVGGAWRRKVCGCGRMRKEGRVYIIALRRRLS